MSGVSDSAGARARWREHRGPVSERPGAGPRRGGRRDVGRRRIAAWVLIALGALMLADVAATLVWQEPVSAVVALIRRSDENRSLLTLHLSKAEQAQLAAMSSSSQRVAFLAIRENEDAKSGDALGKISIPAISASYTFVQGTETSSLELGPGHYASTSLPGMGGTIAIAGHRTTFLAPFRHLASLRAGEQIVLKMPYGQFTYTIQSLRVIAPNAWWITRGAGYERLVLSACTPLFSAAKRLVVFAKLVRVVPVRNVATTTDSR